MKSIRDIFERTVNLLSLVAARHFLKKTTARLVISASDAVADDLRGEGLNCRIKVLPNTYDAARFHEGVRPLHRADTRRLLGYGAENVVFVFASAGHYRRKGFFLAVAALAMVRETFPHVRLLVVGGTAKRLRTLERWLDRQHADWRHWMTFVGMVTDVERYLAAGDGFLFPSYSEAFALVEVEAAASGLPLFLTRHHGSEMILEDGRNGRFMEFDPGDMAAVLTEFICGKWQPKDLHVSAALDSVAFARLFGAELSKVASERHSHKI